MTVIEDIGNIFSTLHDGTISAWTGDKNLLTLTVECEYLAERIDKSFNKFYVDLFNVDKMELYSWANSINSPTVIKTDYADIFKAELEILSTNIKDNVVIVTCNQHDTTFNYCGGDLTISCQKIQVFDQNKNELRIDEFGEIWKNYWDQCGKK